MGNGAQGWRLPAVIVAVALVALVAFARLGMKPASTLPSVTVDPAARPTAGPTEAAVLPAPTSAPTAPPTPSPTEQGVTFTTVTGPRVDFIKPTGFSSPVSPWPGRFADGIPSAINGETVHRINETLNLAVFSDTGVSGSMLIGGWFQWLPAFGEPCGGPRFQQVCGAGKIADSPLQLDSQGVPVDGVTADGSGPIVIRGIANARCAAPIDEKLRFLCPYAIRVQAVVWHGDGYTDSEPITAQPLLQRLGRTVRDFNPQPYHDQPTCLVPRPAQAYRSDTGKLQFVFVFASTADRVAGATSLLIGPPYSDAGSGCDKRPPLDGNSGWISVANVIVCVSDVDGPVGAKVRRMLYDLSHNRVFGAGG
jgi:hypothetical protein